jgi:hypothetical protein
MGLAALAAGTWDICSEDARVPEILLTPHPGAWFIIWGTPLKTSQAQTF